MRCEVKMIVAACLLFLAMSGTADGQPLTDDTLPFVGAQVFVEPGQAPGQIDSFFSSMSEAGMTVCRIRMFESYMRCPDGWDFSLFDQAFDSAEKYGIKVYCTLFPEADRLDLGGWKFPNDETVWNNFKEFIGVLVPHYKDREAMCGWVLINEPGGLYGKNIGTPFLTARRTLWDAAHPEEECTEQGYPVILSTGSQRFLADVTTSFLGEIAAEITKYDKAHDIHVNPHAVFGNYGEYDFPSWRTFLTSLGGSAHPSWHFGYFKREDYALAMMAEAEMLRSGAGDMPWFMTEIQGGNNTYSGGNALCPTAAETAQWLWTVIGCEGKGGIFWSLNPRASGVESGEWGLLDFQGGPSDRMNAAAEVAHTIAAHPDAFVNAREQSSGIDVLYVRESLWAENLLGKGQEKNERYEGRRKGAVIKSAVACFRALSEKGLNVGLKEISEYDFTEEDYKGRTVIIPNQISISSGYASRLEHFVRSGGTLIVEGLTAYYDEHLQCNHVSGFPFADVFGGRISEYILEDNIFAVRYGRNGLPGHLWRGRIAGNEGDVLITPLGKGKSVWIPSNIALGAWVSDDYEGLSDFLLSHMAQDAAVGFDDYYRGLLLRTLDTKAGELIICISNSEKTRTPAIMQHNLKKSVILHASDGCRLMGRRLVMPPQSFCVVLIPNE